MSNFDLIKVSFKEFYKNKVNYINIVFISFTAAIIIFCISFATSLNSYWKESIKKMVDYRTFFVYYDYNLYNEEKAMNLLKTFEHIESVSPYSSYIISMKKVEQKNSDIETYMFLFGVPPKSVKVTNGEDIGAYESNDKVMVCPEDIFSEVTKGDQKYIKKFNLINSIGEIIDLSFVGNENNYEQFKLVGTYDSSTRQGNDNFCYTNSDVVMNLNYFYQPNVYEEKEGIFFPIIVRIDSTDNITQTLANLSEEGFYTNNDAVVRIDTSDGNKILSLLICISLISIIFSCIISFFTLVKNHKKKYRMFAILKTCGYNKKEVIKLQYCESCFSIILTIVLSLTINYFVQYVFQQNIINREEMFNGLIINTCSIGLIFGIIFCILTYIILIKLVNNRITEKEIMEELNN